MIYHIMFGLEAHILSRHIGRKYLPVHPRHKDSMLMARAYLIEIFEKKGLRLRFSPNEEGPKLEPPRNIWNVVAEDGHRQIKIAEIHELGPRE